MLFKLVGTVVNVDVVVDVVVVNVVDVCIL